MNTTFPISKTILATSRFPSSVRIATLGSAMPRSLSAVRAPLSGFAALRVLDSNIAESLSRLRTTPEIFHPKSFTNTAYAVTHFSAPHLQALQHVPEQRQALLSGLTAHGQGAPNLMADLSPASAATELTGIDSIRLAGVGDPDTSSGVDVTTTISDIHDVLGNAHALSAMTAEQIASRAEHRAFSVENAFSNLRSSLETLRQNLAPEAMPWVLRIRDMAQGILGSPVVAKSALRAGVMMAMVGALVLANTAPALAAGTVGTVTMSAIGAAKAFMASDLGFWTGLGMSAAGVVSRQLSKHGDFYGLLRNFGTYAAPVGMTLFYLNLAFNLPFTSMFYLPNFLLDVGRGGGIALGLGLPLVTGIVNGVRLMNKAFAANQISQTGLTADDSKAVQRTAFDIRTQSLLTGIATSFASYYIGYRMIFTGLYLAYLAHYWPMGMMEGLGYLGTTALGLTAAGVASRALRLDRVHPSDHEGKERKAAWLTGLHGSLAMVAPVVFGSAMGWEHAVMGFGSMGLGLGIAHLIAQGRGFKSSVPKLGLYTGFGLTTPLVGGIMGIGGAVHPIGDLISAGLALFVLWSDMPHAVAHAIRFHKDQWLGGLMPDTNDPDVIESEKKSMAGMFGGAWKKLSTILEKPFVFANDIVLSPLVTVFANPFAGVSQFVLQQDASAHAGRSLDIIVARQIRDRVQSRLAKVSAIAFSGHLNFFRGLLNDYRTGGGAAGPVIYGVIADEISQGIEQQESAGQAVTSEWLQNFYEQVIGEVARQENVTRVAAREIFNQFVAFINEGSFASEDTIRNGYTSLAASYQGIADYYETQLPQAIMDLRDFVMSSKIKAAGNAEWNRVNDAAIEIFESRARELREEADNLLARRNSNASLTVAEVRSVNRYLLQRYDIELTVLDRKSDIFFLSRANKNENQGAARELLGDTAYTVLMFDEKTQRYSKTRVLATHVRRNNPDYDPVTNPQRYIWVPREQFADLSRHRSHCPNVAYVQNDATGKPVAIILKDANGTVIPLAGVDAQYNGVATNRYKIVGVAMAESAPETDVLRTRLQGIQAQARAAEQELDQIKKQKLQVTKERKQELGSWAKLVGQEEWANLPLDVYAFDDHKYEVNLDSEFMDIRTAWEFVPRLVKDQLRRFLGITYAFDQSIDLRYGPHIPAPVLNGERVLNRIEAFTGPMMLRLSMKTPTGAQNDYLIPYAQEKNAPHVPTATSASRQTSWGAVKRIYHPSMITKVESIDNGSALEVTVVPEQAPDRGLDQIVFKVPYTPALPIPTAENFMAIYGGYAKTLATPPIFQETRTYNWRRILSVRAATRPVNGQDVPILLATFKADYGNNLEVELPYYPRHLPSPDVINQAGNDLTLITYPERVGGMPYIGYTFRFKTRQEAQQAAEPWMESGEAFRGTVEIREIQVPNPQTQLNDTFFEFTMFDKAPSRFKSAYFDPRHIDMNALTLNGNGDQRMLHVEAIDLKAKLFPYEDPFIDVGSADDRQYDVADVQGAEFASQWSAGQTLLRARFAGGANVQTARLGHKLTDTIRIIDTHLRVEGVASPRLQIFKRKEHSKKQHTSKRLIQFLETQAEANGYAVDWISHTEFVADNGVWNLKITYTNPFTGTDHEVVFDDITQGDKVLASLLPSLRAGEAGAPITSFYQDPRQYANMNERRARLATMPAYRQDELKRYQPRIVNLESFSGNEGTIRTLVPYIELTLIESLDANQIALSEIADTSAPPVSGSDKPWETLVPGRQMLMEPLKDKDLAEAQKIADTFELHLINAKSAVKLMPTDSNTSITDSVWIPLPDEIDGLGHLYRPMEGDPAHPDNRRRHTDRDAKLVHERPRFEDGRIGIIVGPQRSLAGEDFMGGQGKAAYPFSEHDQDTFMVNDLEDGYGFRTRPAIRGRGGNIQAGKSRVGDGRARIGAVINSGTPVARPLDKAIHAADLFYDVEFLEAPFWSFAPKPETITEDYRESKWVYRRFGHSVLFIPKIVAIGAAVNYPTQVTTQRRRWPASEPIGQYWLGNDFGDEILRTNPIYSFFMGSKNRHPSLYTPDQLHHEINGITWYYVGWADYARLIAPPAYYLGFNPFVADPYLFPFLWGGYFLSGITSYVYSMQKAGNRLFRSLFGAPGVDKTENQNYIEKDMPRFRFPTDRYPREENGDRRNGTWDHLVARSVGRGTFMRLSDEVEGPFAVTALAGASGMPTRYLYGLGNIMWLNAAAVALGSVALAHQVGLGWPDPDPFLADAPYNVDYASDFALRNFGLAMNTMWPLYNLIVARMGILFARHAMLRISPERIAAKVTTHSLNGAWGAGLLHGWRWATGFLRRDPDADHNLAHAAAAFVGDGMAAVMHWPLFSRWVGNFIVPPLNTPAQKAAYLQNYTPEELADVFMVGWQKQSRRRQLRPVIERINAHHLATIFEALLPDLEDGSDGARGFRTQRMGYYMTQVSVDHARARAQQDFDMRSATALGMFTSLWRQDQNRARLIAAAMRDEFRAKLQNILNAAQSGININ